MTATNALFPDLSAYISQRHSVLILYDRTPRALMRDDEKQDELAGWFGRRVTAEVF